VRVLYCRIGLSIGKLEQRAASVKMGIINKNLNQRETRERCQNKKVGTSIEAFFSFALRFSSSSFFCLRLTR
jgi:hypothetical protein